jgi:hypothetical protein
MSKYKESNSFLDERVLEVNPGELRADPLRPRGSRLTLLFDGLRVLSLRKEATLLFPALKGGV